MGQHDGVDASGIDWKRLPVPLAKHFQTLEQSAVDQHRSSRFRDEEPRARDRPSRS